MKLLLTSAGISNTSIRKALIALLGKLSDSTALFVPTAIYGIPGGGEIPQNSLAKLEKLAATLPMRSYAIDDNTAVKLVDNIVEVISEGHWELFEPDKSNNL